MSASNSPVKCPVLVLAVTCSQISGDDTADALRDHFLAAVVQTQAQNVVLDLSPVNYLSSAGFRPLLSLHRLLRQHGGKLLLCGLSEPVTEVLEVTRLISTRGMAKAPFEVYPNVASAVASLSLSGPGPA